MFFCILYAVRYILLGQAETISSATCKIEFHFDLVLFSSNMFVFRASEAIKNIILYLGMQPCERSDKVPEGKSSHTLFLAGVFRGGHDALVRAKLALTDSGVTMQLTVRSTDPYVSEVLATAIA